MQKKKNCPLFLNAYLSTSTSFPAVFLYQVLSINRQAVVMLKEETVWGIGNATLIGYGQLKKASGNPSSEPWMGAGWGCL